MSKRLDPYLFEGWKISHYVISPEEFRASKGARVLRDTTKEGIENQIRNLK